MIMKIEVEHAIEPGKTCEALRVLREIGGTGLNTSRIELLKRVLNLETVSKDGGDGDHTEGEKAASDLRSYLQEPSRIRVRLLT
ncbi:MAG: hypothetical protein R6U89_08930 [Dehalococcoidia bacterium]